jgi:hypothetical protein
MRLANVFLGILALAGGVVLLFRWMEDDIVMGVWLLAFGIITLLRKN